MEHQNVADVNRRAPRTLSSAATAQRAYAPYPPLRTPAPGADGAYLPGTVYRAVSEDVGAAGTR
jgi:hypothetical protein